MAKSSTPKGDSRSTSKQSAKSAKGKSETPKAPPAPAVPLADVYRKNKALAAQLEDACVAFREAQDQIDIAIKMQTDLRVDIEALSKKLGVNRVEGETWLMKEASGESSHLSATRLLELGVKQSVIEKATKRTPWSKFQVLARKPGGEEE